MINLESVIKSCSVWSIYFLASWYELSTVDLNAGPSQVLTSMLKKIADDIRIKPLGRIENKPKKRKNLLKSLNPITDLFLYLI